MKNLIRFFDKLEDHVREHLSRHPIIYSMIGGVAVVLFWKGIWDLADTFELDGHLALLVSIPILLVTGLFVSFFVADRVILSGLKHEEKLLQQTETEIEGEESLLKVVAQSVKELNKEVRELKEELVDKK